MIMKVSVTEHKLERKHENVKPPAKKQLPKTKKAAKATEKVTQKHYCNLTIPQSSITGPEP